MEKNKKIVVISLIFAIVIIIGCMLSIFINSLNTNKTNKPTTTKNITKSTEKYLKDEVYGINISYSDNKEISDDSKLVVTKISDSINIENVVALYDISLKDKNNNIVNVSNTKLKVSIPFDNSLNYDEFKVLYLSDENEIKETINATYSNGKVSFYVNHLSKYAVVATKSENNTTTTTTTVKQQTTKKSVSNNTTVKQQETTKKQETTKQQETTTTTKKRTETTTTTTTTKKIRTFSVIWGSEKSAAGQQYLYIVDESGTKVSGSVLVSYKGSNYSETINVSTNGVLLIKDIVTISNVKGS